MRRISLLGLVALVSVTSAAFRSPAVTHSHKQRPLSFQPNHGQSDPRVDYLSRGPGYTLFLSSNEAVLSFGAASPAPPGSVLRINDDAVMPESRAQYKEKLCVSVSPWLVIGVRHGQRGADPLNRYVGS